MSFPASLTTRTVTGRFVTYPAGTPAKGTVRIVLNNFMQGPTDDAFVAPFDETIKLVNGAFSIVLPATNDPQWTASYYKVTITADDKVVRSRFDVPYNDSAALDLADILNLPAATPGESYVLLSSRGVAGGVAGLGSDGKVPAGQLPAASGGTIYWDDVEDKPTTFPAEPVSYEDLTDVPDLFPPVMHDHPMPQVTGLVDALSLKADLVSGVIPTAQIPVIAIIDFLGSVSTQGAMLALVGQKGDWCIRTDLGKTYVITGSNPTQLSSWTPMPLPAVPVQSVNGQIGDVVLGKTEVGLGNVDNTSDAAKPVSTAQQTALNLKAPLASPTFTGTVSGVTAAMVGLGNVTNTSDANKPVSTAQQTALDLKAPLASPAFTGTPTGITKTHVGLGNADNTSDANKPVSTAQQTALDLKAPLASPAFTGTPTGITKTHVGLGNVDNTSDVSKPVSTAQQTALDLKAPLASPTFTGTVSGVTAAMVGLGNVNNTSDANKPVSTAQQTALDTKVDEDAIIVYAKDHGVVADGVTDDIAALRLAAQALPASGGVVLLPDGVIAVSSWLIAYKTGTTFRGKGKNATTVKAIAAMSTMVTGTSVSARRNRICEDITFDANSLAVNVDSLGYTEAFSGYRRCRFINMNAIYLSISGVHDAVVEDCEFVSDGIVRGTALSLGQGSKRIKIRNNKFHYCENSIVVDTGVSSSTEDEYLFADSIIEGNQFDGGWWLIPYQAANSGGAVTYTATTITDTAASFATLAVPNKFNVRVMATLATGSGGTVTYPRTEIVDTGATFRSSGVARGHIVRVGSAFAVVSNVRSETNLAVEEWLDDANRSRVTVPTAGTAYTVYNVVLGSVQSNTGTVLTVTRWHDLLGNSVTPSGGTRYELLYQRPNYTIHSELGTRNIRVSGNLVRRPWSDGISIYGPDVQIVNNTVEDGEDMGITCNGTAMISGNKIRRQGAGGIFSSGDDCTIVGNDVQDSSWVNSVDTRSLGDIMVYGGSRATVVGNTCRSNGSRPQSRHGIVLYGATAADNLVEANKSSGHTVADYRVDQTVAAANDVRFANGTLVIGSGAAPQRIDGTGTGSPEGVYAGTVGSSWRRTDGGTASTQYVRETLGASNTGWTAFGPAATIRVTTAASTATPTPNASTSDMYELTALAVGATFAAPIGTPADGQSLMILIKDNGSAQTLAWNAAYRAVGTTLPVVTSAGKQLYVGCKYNSTASKWDVLAVASEA